MLEGVLHAAGLDRLQATRLLASEGLHPDSLTSPALGADGAPLPAMIPLATYMRLFDHMARTLAKPALGLDLAGRMGPGLIGPIGYVLLHSPTLGAGLTAFSESVFSIQGVTSLAFTRDGGPSLTYAISDEAMRPRRQDVEFSLAYVHDLIKQALGGQFAPREVYFEHARAADLTRYESFFGCPVYFEQSGNVLVLEEADLSRPLPRADAALVGMLRHYIALMDRRDATPSSRGETVEQILGGMIGTQPAAIGHVAAMLDTGVDTLRRQLRGEGNSYRALLRRKRITMACRLLQETDLSVLEVASRVGYAETASFTRAFRAETGQPPLNWRQANRLTG